MKQARLWFSFFVALFFSVTDARAGEYFVAVDGEDDNPGSWRRPFGTIQKAADLMKPGDTCYVRGGVYRQALSPKCSGTRGKPIRFEAWPGEVVMLSGTEPIRVAK